MLFTRVPFRSLALTAVRSLRGIHYNKNGELISHPPAVKTKELYHPVLGKYYSEFPVENNPPNLANRYPKSAMKESLSDPNTSLLHAARDHHTRLWDKGSRRQMFDEQLQLGQVVMIRRRVCATKPQKQMFFGVLIEKSGKDLQAYIRLRSIIMQTGVELKLPVFSPLLDEIRIISEPEQKVIGPNLLGLRNSTEDLSRYINPFLFTDKGRMIFTRYLRESPDLLADLVTGKLADNGLKKHGQHPQQNSPSAEEATA